MTARASDGSKIGNRARPACEICGKRYPHTCVTPASARTAPTCPRCGVEIPLTLDDNSGDLRYRCETCDVEQCAHCGPSQLVSYSDDAPAGYYHLTPGVACFLHAALDAETIATLEATR